MSEGVSILFDQAMGYIFGSTDHPCVTGSAEFLQDMTRSDWQVIEQAMEHASADDAEGESLQIEPAIMREFARLAQSKDWLVQKADGESLFNVILLVQGSGDADEPAAKGLTVKLPGADRATAAERAQRFMMIEYKLGTAFDVSDIAVVDVLLGDEPEQLVHNGPAQDFVRRVASLSVWHDEFDEGVPENGLFGDHEQLMALIDQARAIRDGEAAADEQSGNALAAGEIHDDSASEHAVVMALSSDVVEAWKSGNLSALAASVERLAAGISPAMSDKVGETDQPPEPEIDQAQDLMLEASRVLLEAFDHPKGRLSLEAMTLIEKAYAMAAEGLSMVQGDGLDTPQAVAARKLHEAMGSGDGMLSGRTRQRLNEARASAQQAVGANAEMPDNEDERASSSLPGACESRF